MEVIESLEPHRTPHEPLFEGLSFRPEELRLGRLVVMQQVFYGPVSPRYTQNEPRRKHVVEELEFCGAADVFEAELAGAVTSEFEDLLFVRNGKNVVVPAGVFGVTIRDSSNQLASLFNFYSGFVTERNSHRRSML